MSVHSSSSASVNHAPEIAFLDALNAAGLEFQGPIIADGVLHRFKADGDRNPNSFYVLHLDGVAAGSFGCWKRGISETWCAVGNEGLTEAERAERDRRWKQHQADREADRQRQQNEAAGKAQAILDAAAPAPDDHPYLVRKAVKAYPGLMMGAWPQRQIENCLLIPLRTADGRLATVQAIFPVKPDNGRDKDFLRGGSTKGAHFTLGDLQSADVIIIAEGYATAATLHDATGHPAVMALDAGNLRPVAEILKKLHPKTRFIIAADNDRFTEGNPGIAKATTAAKAIKATLAVPPFVEGEPGTDFNDLAALHGLDAVRAAIEGAAVKLDASGQTDTAPTENPYRGTDDANADLLLGLHGADIRYCPPWEKWLIWSGSHWAIDGRLDIEKISAAVPRSLRARAVAQTEKRQALLAQMAETLARAVVEPEQAGRLTAEHKKLDKQQAALGDEIDWLLKLSGKLEGTGTRAGMLLAARHKVVVHHSDLDKGHFLLNARNGTIDLSTGRLRPHDRADLMTHDTEIAYHPDAACPVWLRFLSEVFAGDEDLIRFVQRAVGYSLTGDVREQVLLICHGVGSNGKSVFLNILRKLLGGLAWQAAPDLLMQDKQRRHPTEQADLFGKRVVVCQETGEGRRFNETLVKQLTGGDGITARRMHEDFWQFNPTHKLWLSTNHRPEIRGTDHAIWRRIRLIPFNVKFTDDGEPAKDPLMEERLTAELPGILAWAVQGCLDWQRQGLGLAAAVSAATDEYQAEMDVLAAWMNQCCVVGKRCEARAADLYRSYVSWCEQGGEFPEKQRKFGMRLKERGFVQFTNNGVWWRGLGLSSFSTEGTEGTEPEKAKVPLGENKKPFDSKTAFSGSDGSVGSVNQNLSPDARALADVLKHYRGWAMPDELARKSGLGGTTRVMVAAQELTAKGLARMEGGMVKPVGVEG